MLKVMLIQLTILLIVFYAFNLHCQNSDNYVGHYFDWNGQIIDEYMDRDYFPIGYFIKTSIENKGYAYGHYYNKSNEKVEGLLQYMYVSNKVKFKEDLDAEVEIIEPENCNGYVIGVDSFAVIENFMVQTGIGQFKKKKKIFAEVIANVDNKTFFSYRATGEVNVVWVLKYLVKNDLTNEFISLPIIQEKFVDVASECFKDYPFLKFEIESGKYNTREIEKIVSLYSYYKKYIHKKKLWFDKSWNKLRTKGKAAYYGIIDSIKNTKFFISYYNLDHSLLYTGQYSSIVPEVKVGEFNYYRKDGKLRKKVEFVDNKPIYISSYFESGQKHYSYKLIEGKPIFVKVFDTKGNEILNNQGDGVEELFDSISDRRIIRNFDDYRLTSSYYFDKKNRKIFQLCQKKAKLLPFKRSDKKDYYFTYPYESIKNNTHGAILVKCIVEPTGVASDVQIVKGIDEYSDKAILDLFTILKTNKYWIPARVDGKKVTQEIVLPIEMYIGRFFFWNLHEQISWSSSN